MKYKVVSSAFTTDILILGGKLKSVIKPSSDEPLGGLFTPLATGAPLQDSIIDGNVYITCTSTADAQRMMKAKKISDKSIIGAISISTH